MKLGFEESQAAYTSGSQRAREWTERWVKDWVYCPNCGNRTISQFPANSPLPTSTCPACAEQYELKSQKSRFGQDRRWRLPDHVRAAGVRRQPNLFLLNYDLKSLSVVNALVIPKQFFVRKIIEERPPLAANRTPGRLGRLQHPARSNPGIGENLLRPRRARSPKASVLTQWERIKFLRDTNADAARWLIEVMNCVESLGKREFTLDDVYAFEPELARLYPNNRHVKQKIRQQLQVLRDKGYLSFESRGSYRLRADP